jgi:hypothetical protein
LWAEQLAQIALRFAGKALEVAEAMEKFGGNDEDVLGMDEGHAERGARG